jgi:hypothetical protein
MATAPLPATGGSVAETSLADQAGDVLTPSRLAKWCQGCIEDLTPSVAWRKRNPRAEKCVTDLVQGLIGLRLGDEAKSIRIRRHRSTQAAIGLLSEWRDRLQNMGTEQDRTTVGNKRRGRKKASDESIQRDNRLADEWARAKGNKVYKADFARDNKFTLNDFDRLLNRVARRKKRRHE